MSLPPITVGCVRWGTRYGADYVNVLHRAVAAHLSHPHRFLCVTETVDGLDPEIETRPFPDINVPRKEWNKGSWPKLGLMAPGVMADDEIVLQLDLDILVVGGLEVFIDLVREKPAFYTLREWNPALLRALVPEALRPVRGTQGSVYAYRAGDQRHIFEDFTTRTAEVRARYKSDRFYFPEIARDQAFLPAAWCPSFKNACLWYWPLNRAFGVGRPPQDARIIAFHGKPRPIDLLGPPGRRWGTARKFGSDPVPWVVEYWTGYGGTLPA